MRVYGFEMQDVMCGAVRCGIYLAQSRAKLG